MNNIHVFIVKKVQFSKDVEIYPICFCKTHALEARNGSFWYMDGIRFRQRIMQTEKILESVLRNKIRDINNNKNV